jgi:hypothetical protein
MLVEMRQARIFWRFCHAAVLGGDLDGDQREGVVLGDEDGEAVRAGVLADGGRGEGWGGGEEQRGGSG